MKTLTIDQFINEVNDGKTFGVEFIKRSNGEYRVMSARRGVKKGVKNVEDKRGSWNRVENDKKHGVLTCYDMNKVDESIELEENKGAFRRIPLDGIVKVSVHGVQYVMDKESGVLVSEG